MDATLLIRFKNAIERAKSYPDYIEFIYESLDRLTIQDLLNIYQRRIPQGIYVLVPQTYTHILNITHDDLSEPLIRFDRSLRIGSYYGMGMDDDASTGSGMEPSFLVSPENLQRLEDWIALQNIRGLLSRNRRNALKRYRSQSPPPHDVQDMDTSIFEDDLQNSIKRMRRFRISSSNDVLAIVKEMGLYDLYRSNALFKKCVEDIIIMA
jgi:hypothetical protein